MKKIADFVPSTSWKASEESGCKRLLFAIMERAILDLVGNKRTKQSHCRNNFLHEGALNWIFDTRHPKEINSYERICHLFDLDPSYLRNPKTRAKVLEYYRHTDLERRKYG